LNFLDYGAAVGVSAMSPIAVLVNVQNHCPLLFIFTPFWFLADIPKFGFNGKSMLGEMNDFFRSHFGLRRFILALRWL
jgi:hypothetical protein